MPHGWLGSRSCWTATYGIGWTILTHGLPHSVSGRRTCSPRRGSPARMPSSPHGDDRVVGAGMGEPCLHVAGARAAGDERRPHIARPVIQLAGPVVTWVAGPDQLAGQGRGDAAGGGGCHGCSLPRPVAVGLIGAFLAGRRGSGT